MRRLPLLLGLLLLAASALQATNLTRYSFYPRAERLDVMLTFDGPFTGEIARQSSTDYVSVELSGLQFNDTAERMFDLAWVEGVKIYESNGDTLVVAATRGAVATEASKTANGFGLRLRFTPTQSAAPAPLFGTPPPASDAAAPPTDEDAVAFRTDTINYDTYFLVVFFLALLSGALWYVKRKIAGKPEGWLAAKLPNLQGEIKVLSQKQLDMKNRVILFEADGIRYLVMLGAQGCVLLDKSYQATASPAADASAAGGFDSVLGEHTQKLERYLDEGYDTGEERQRLENFKHKASGARYDAYETTG